MYRIIRQVFAQASVASLIYTYIEGPYLSQVIHKEARSTVFDHRTCAKTPVEFPIFKVKTTQDSALRFIESKVCLIINDPIPSLTMN